MRLLRQALHGGTAKCVLEREGPKFLTDWSSDGQFITYGSQWPDYQSMHTWTMSLSASGQPEGPRPFLKHSYVEATAYFSPADGGPAPRWIAYMSTETGRADVYVRDFPAGDCVWQVSSRGGWLPHWRSDGRELFYLTPHGTLMAVAVNLGDTFEFGTPQKLFETGLRLTPYNMLDQYAVARDEQRFLLNRRVSETVPNAVTAMIPW